MGITAGVTSPGGAGEPADKKEKPIWQHTKLPWRVEPELNRQSPLCLGCVFLQTPSARIRAVLHRSVIQSFP